MELSYLSETSTAIALKTQMWFIIFQFPFSVHPLSSCSPVLLLPHTLRDGLLRI